MPALGIMSLSTFVVCVTAAFTQIIAFDLKIDLNSLIGNDYQWMFPAFIAGECASMSICAGVIDRVGRKTPYIVGTLFFIVGSAMCALSTDMTFFIIARAIQGIGAGPVIVTCVAQIFFTVKDPKYRYISNGILSLGFGGGMLMGIFAGRIAVNTIGWANFMWVVLIAQAVLAVPCMRVLSVGECSKKKSDVFGGILLAAASSVFIIYLEGAYLIKDLSNVWALVGLAVLLLLVILFIVVEKFNPDSIFHRTLDNRKLMAASLIMIILLGAIDMGTVGWMVKLALFTYDMDILQALPYFIMLVLGASVTAIAASKLIIKTGQAFWFILSAILTPIALLYVADIKSTDPPYMLAVHLFLIGLAIGCLVSLINATIQNRTDGDSNGGYMSFALMVRTAALWLGYNLYQAEADIVFKRELGSTMDHWNSVLGINLPCDSNLASLLATPLGDALRIIPGLTDSIADTYVLGVFDGFSVMGILFFVIAVIVTLALARGPKVY